MYLVYLQPMYSNYIANKVSVLQVRVSDRNGGVVSNPKNARVQIFYKRRKSGKCLYITAYI